jgi:ABC-2 type transport system permease protein
LVLFILIPVLVVVAFAMVVMTIAVRAQSRAMLTWLSTASIGLVFGSVAPVEVVPSWVRPLVQFQPMWPTMESMRALSQGSLAVWPLLMTFAWILGLATVFGPLAVRGYRAAAEGEG